jgi:hypothetical protein
VIGEESSVIKYDPEIENVAFSVDNAGLQGGSEKY